MAYFYPRHDLKEAYENAGIDLHFLDLGGRYSFVTGYRRLLKLVRELQPDVMVSSLMRANLMTRMVSLRTGIPLVGTFVNDSYGDIRVEEKSGSGYWKFKAFWLLDKWTSGIPVKWISNANSIADSNAKALGIDRDKIVTVYRGRDVSVFPVWKQRNEKVFRFMAYGRLLERKGFAELIQAFNRLEREDVELVIYGEGPYRGVLDGGRLTADREGYLTTKNTKVDNNSSAVNGQRSTVKKQVSLPGSKQDVFKELINADCFVFPSWYEGFSGALVEAMMAGVPIIASDIEMNKEAVTDCETALLFRVKDEDDLLEKMQYALENKVYMVGLGANARKEARERFDIKKIALEYENQLFEITTETQRHRENED